MELWKMKKTIFQRIKIRCYKTGITPNGIKILRKHMRKTPACRK